ncbi:MAG: hypothetical protein WAN93_07875 [Solirubrobacteraceae bacterium]
MANDDQLNIASAVVDSGLFFTEQQLRAFVHMQEHPDLYMSRITEHLDFLPGSGQQWKREVQVQLPILDSESDNDSYRDFIVSLGRFQRRRFPDFKVTAADGSRCRLASRDQHGQCIASCILQPLLFSEWNKVAESEYATDVLSKLRTYLSRMTTTIAINDQYTPTGARILFDALLVAIDTDLEHMVDVSSTFYASCEAALGETQYLCWVSAKPGDVVHLSATYTQADSPQFKDESDGITDSKRRLWLRNFRTKQYARYNLFPMRYTLSTPAYRDCRSYYFTITPPPETKTVLLDWGKGRRVHVASRDTDWSRGGVWKRRTPVSLFDEVAEVDCASFSYHFHNRRVNQDASSREKRKQVKLLERRKQSVASGVKLHAFIRAEPIDNGKFAAIGLLGLTLAVLAERGALLANASGSSASQWLLLTPAVMLVYVGQQQRHHYARFTRPFRLAVWFYLALAMLFAASIAFSITSIPPVYGSADEVLPRTISAAFAIASGVVVALAAWSGKHFEKANRHRHGRVLERVRLFATPSKVEIWRKYRLRPSYWRRIRSPLSSDEIDRAKLKGSDTLRGGDPRNNHPSNNVYAAIARHSIDRIFAIAALIVILVSFAMVLHVPDWHWGLGEECVIEKEQERQLAAENGKPLGQGHCSEGHWHKAK